MKPGAPNDRRLSRMFGVGRGGVSAGAILRLFLLAILLLLVRTAVPVHAAGVEISALPQDIQRLYNSGRYNEAEQALSAALQAKPRDSTLLYWLGRCFYELHDFAQSISSLERAIDIDPNQSEFHDWLGKAWGRKAEESGRLGALSALTQARKASREFALAVRLNPANLEAERDLIRYLTNAPGIAGGSEQRAEEQIATLNKVDPIEAELARAESYAAKKKFDQANEEYQNLLSRPALRASMALEAAEYYRDRGDAQHMEQAVKAAAAVDPSDPRLKYYRGVMLVLAHRNLDDAEKDLRSYLDTVPSSAEVPPRSSAHDWLGRLYEREKQPDKAAQEYRSALEADPHDKDARDALKQLPKK